MKKIGTLLLTLCCFVETFSQINTAYLDSKKSTEERVAILLSQMTLEEKIGQLQLYSMDFSKNITDSGSAKPLAWYKKYHVGSVINALDDDIVLIQKELGENSRLGIPLLTMIDAINGHSFYPNTTIFPSQLALSHTWNKELMYDIGKITATEMAATGVHVNYGPGVDIARDLRWGRVGETFGEDTYLVSQLGLARIQGLQGDDLASYGNVAATAKHFVGYGETVGGRDATEFILSERHLRTEHLPPFKLAISKGNVAMVMAGYHAVNGVPASGNSWLLNNLLRDELGFKGMVVSDWENYSRLIDTHLVSADEIEAAIQIISAGNDMPMSAYALPEALKNAVEKGLLDEAVIDTVCKRVLRLKFQLGLFDNKSKLLPSAKKNKILANSDHMKVALESAYQSVVLLENKNKILPLDETNIKNIAVVGPNADDIVAQLGDWSLGFRGQGPWQREVPQRTKNHTTILKGLQNRVGSNININYVKGSDVLDANFDEISKAVEAARKSDVVIVVIGDNRLLTGEQQDRAVLNFTGKQLEMMERLKQTGKPIITIVVASKPLILEPVVNMSDALVLAINPRMSGGEAVAGIVFGDQNPSGKITVTIPHKVGQLPAHYSQSPGWHGNGHYIDLDSITKKPLYSFGYGMSYTKFQYGALSLNNTKLKKGQALKGTFKLKNIGKVAGTEIAQIYIQDKVASVVRPLKLLKEFKRVNLKPNEEKTIEFEIPYEALSILNFKNKWIVEPGEFTIYIGGSSRDEDLNLKNIFSVEK